MTGTTGAASGSPASGSKADATTSAKAAPAAKPAPAPPKPEPLAVRLDPWAFVSVILGVASLLLFIAAGSLVLAPFAIGAAHVGFQRTRGPKDTVKRRIAVAGLVLGYALALGGVVGFVLHLAGIDIPLVF